jgi:hypothetical protein
MRNDMLARIETLEAELARLKAELGRTAATTDGPDADELTPHPPVAEEPSRRDLLRYGAIALGTTAPRLSWGTAIPVPRKRQFSAPDPVRRHSGLPLHPLH